MVKGITTTKDLSKVILVETTHLIDHESLLNLAECV